MIAWYGEQKLKDAAMKRLREHQRLDQLAQGVYFENGKGCHLGCLTHCNENSQAAASRMFGLDPKIPFWLEAVFEGLPKEDAARWVIESTEAIPVGADLSMCHHELAYWLLDPVSPVGANNSHELVADAVAQVRECHRVALDGGDPDWSAARSAAESAAESAWSAAESAESAAESARSAAWSAAWSAAESARSAAVSAAWSAIAAKSIEIFRNAPVRAADECERCEQCVAESMFALRGASFVEVGDE